MLSYLNTAVVIAISKIFKLIIVKYSVVSYFEVSM